MGFCKVLATVSYLTTVCTEQYGKDAPRLSLSLRPQSRIDDEK